MTTAEFTFDDVTHTYRLQGQKLLSVTEVIQENGWVNPQWFTERARVRGKYVHLLTQFYDENDYNPIEAQRLKGFIDEDPNAGLEGYVESWRKARERVPFDLIDIEKPGYHPTLMYAGTPDRHVRFGKQEGIVDVKTGGYERWHGFQSAAYDSMLGRAASGIRKRLSIHLYGDGRLATIVEHHDFYDGAQFNCMLACTKKRREHGINRIGA